MKHFKYPVLKLQGKRSTGRKKRASVCYARAEPPTWLEAGLRQSLQAVAENCPTSSSDTETAVLARLIAEMERGKRKKYSWQPIWSWLGATAILALLFLSFVSPWANQQTGNQLTLTTSVVRAAVAPASQLEALSAAPSAPRGQATALPAMDLSLMPVRGTTFPAKPARTEQQN